MSSDKLNQAINLIKSGRKDEALSILKEVVKAEPNNELGWLSLYACVNAPEQKIYCLEKALKINPNNQKAQDALKTLYVQSRHLTAQNEKQIPIQKLKNVENSDKRKPQHKRVIKNKNANSTFLSGVILLLAFCFIGALLWGGYLTYKNFLLPVGVAETEAESPQIVDTLDTEGEPYYSTPSTNENPSNPPQDDSTIVVQPTKNLRFVPYAFERASATVPGLGSEREGWDNIAVSIAIENPTNSFIAFANDWHLESQPAVRVKTSQGYEYSCDSLRGNFSTTTDSNDYIFIPPQGRVLYYTDCDVPDPSSGFTLTISYEEIVFLDKAEKPRYGFCGESPAYDAYSLVIDPEKCTSYKSTVELNPEQTTTNLTFPFLETANADMEKYMSENNIVPLYVNQPFDVFDATIVFKAEPPASETYYQDKFFFSYDVTSNFLGGDLIIRMQAVLYSPDGALAHCVLESDRIGPGLTINGDSCNKYDLINEPALPKNSCLFIYDTNVTTSLSNEKFPSNFLICFE